MVWLVGLVISIFLVGCGRLCGLILVILAPTDPSLGAAPHEWRHFLISLYPQLCIAASYLGKFVPARPAPPTVNINKSSRIFPRRFQSRYSQLQSVIPQNSGCFIKFQPLRANFATNWLLAVLPACLRVTFALHRWWKYDNRALHLTHCSLCTIVHMQFLILFLLDNLGISILDSGTRCSSYQFMSCRIELNLEYYCH